MGSVRSRKDEGRRILFVDAFDSFTNNVIGLLEQTLGVEVTLVHIDDKNVDQNLHETLDAFDAVVIGPGPGHPSIPSDVGFIDKLWQLSDAHMLPILGICLGFQSLCFAHGAKVTKLRSPRHGIISRVSHIETDIFAGIKDLDATQYHSLHAEIGVIRSDDEADRNGFWEPTKTCPSLQPLAWDFSDDTNGHILMAAHHVTNPWWGVQFHPESICTSESGKELVLNWWAHALDWLNARQRRTTLGWVKANVGQRSMPRGDPSKPDVAHEQNSAIPQNASHLAQELRSALDTEAVFLSWGKHPAACITPTSLLEALGQSREEVVLLDSQGHASGRYSIIGLVDPGKSMKITYKVTDGVLRYGFGSGKTFATHLNSVDEVWPILQEALDLHDPRNGKRFLHEPQSGPNHPPTGMNQFVAVNMPADSPFWGGFMGYISYEAGLETIEVEIKPPCENSDVPDINFVFIHRSIVIDHTTSQVYVQSLLPSDWAWILSVGGIIDSLASRSELSDSQSSATGNDCSEESAVPRKKVKLSQGGHRLDEILANAEVDRPKESDYRAKVLRCQDFLASGDSYELCLTDNTEIRVPLSNGIDGLDAWALYKRLRQNNPAPFGAFLRLSDALVVGSSPERFLRWTRDGSCQFRPIKGTVKKSPDMTRERAHEILGSSKERAENLMIVDLIRHDLAGVVGAENTWVSKLMVIEEYETVYQLVSVIEGQLPISLSNMQSPRGIHVLKASLPPGSMTGAPKKRSCEILQDIEKSPRGIYSGVLGYMDVGGAGDFSVVIRTAVRGMGQGDKGTNATRTLNGGCGSSTSPGFADHFTKPAEVWRVGAGGAVTIQSTDEGEFLEMETKASSVLGALLRRREGGCQD